MIRLLIFILAAGALCGAQAASPPTQQSAPQPSTNQPQPPSATAPQVAPKPSGTPVPSETGATVSSTQPVITIQGVCAAPAKPAVAGAKATPAKAITASGPCKTLVTKTQFEKLLNAVNPAGQPVAPNMRRNLAQAYVELLTFSQAAQKAGVDKDPNFSEVMRLVRMRTLEDFYRRTLEQKYRNPPPADIQSYYNQNIQKYEEIKLSRIFIPAKNPASPSKDDWEKKAAEVANDIHDRAAKGEDFEKLQKEAYTTLGLTITPPSTSTGNRRRGMMAPQEEQELFALKAGDVSKLEQEPAGYIVYKVESKETLPMEKVKDEISRELFRQKMDTAMKSVTAPVHADYNDEYFGPVNTPPRAIMPPGNVPQPGKAPEPKPPGPGSPSTPPSSSAPPSTSTPPPASQGQAPPK